MDATRGPHHVAVVVADLAASERFYCGVLGLRVVRRWSDADGAPRSVWVATSEADVPFLALEKAALDGPRRDDAAPGLHCLALAIDADARMRWRQRLEAAGLAIERESAFTLYVRDPDGVLVGLSHWPAPAPAPTRADAGR